MVPWRPSWEACSKQSTPPPDRASLKIRLSCDRSASSSRKSDWRGASVCIVGLFFTAFSVFWIVLAINGVQRSRDNVSDTWAWLFPAFGIPFVLIGLGLLTTPLRLAARSRKTIYAITDRRVLIVQKGKSEPVFSCPFDQLKHTEASENADATGIYFLPSTRPCGSSPPGSHRLFQKMHSSAYLK